MSRETIKHSRIACALATALTLLTIFSPSTSRAQETSASDEKTETGASTTIEFPAGRTVGAEKCFDLEGYKRLAIIYGHYLSCEARAPLVFELAGTVDDKRAALSTYADGLALELATIEAEREAYVVAATTSAELADSADRRKRVWRAFAIGGLVVSVVLGAVVAGMGAAR